MAGYCENKYDIDPVSGKPFTGETRTVTTPDPASISGNPIDMAPEAKTRLSRGQTTGNPAGTPIYS